jgi:23S rRNA (cytidine1920-2'-O)/16S rRNA (cytidine1409-2'-O)-methyltransferase
MRLDNFLVERALVDSRTKASRAIKDGRVMVDGKIILKPSYLVEESNQISIKKMGLEFVSQGGNKLQLAVEQLGIDFENKIVLDVGASTGGFTDCALQYGAKMVVCVDVGTGQLHPTLFSDHRVTNLEKTDIRDFVPSGSIPAQYDCIIGDVSFISLAKILPSLFQFLKQNGKMVLLVKPQFEVGPGNANKKGIVTDSKLKKEALDKIKKTCVEHSLKILGEVSTISLTQGEKNEEFLLWVTKEVQDQVS